MPVRAAGPGEQAQPVVDRRGARADRRPHRGGPGRVAHVVHLALEAVGGSTRRGAGYDIARAREVLGAATMKDTVNRALVEVVRLAERRAHADRLERMDGLDLDDDAVMADAWR